MRAGGGGVRVRRGAGGGAAGPLRAAGGLLQRQLLHPPLQADLAQTAGRT